MLKAVIFDVDGTLVDSVDAHAQAWTEALEKFGHPHDFTAVRYQIGKGGDQLIRAFLSESDALRLEKKMEAFRKEVFKSRFLPDIIAFPKVRELFQRIRADGKAIVLASSASGDELGTYKSKAKIEDLVQEETSKDDVAKSKPRPDIFEAAMAKLQGTSPDEAIVIGDSPWDAIAAKRAHVRALGILSGGFHEPDLHEAGCVAVYKDVADLLSRYDESPLAE